MSVVVSNDHWHWCERGLDGVVKMLRRLSKSDLRPQQITLDRLIANRDHLTRLIEKQQQSQEKE